MSEISDRARRLVEELENVWPVLERQAIVQRYLDEEHMEALGPGKPYSPNGTPEVLSCSDDIGEP